MATRADGDARMKPGVLILGGRAPVALDHARRFAMRGWRVHVADSIPCRLSGWSRSVTATHALRSPRRDPDGFAADLDAIAASHRIDLLLPTCEEAFHLSHVRGRLPKELQVAVDDFDKLRALHSKWEFLGLARRHGMDVPDSARVHSLDEARAWAGGRGLVMKPEFSRFGVHVRLHPRGLPAAAPPLPVQGPWVAQAYLDGRELCSYGIAHGGELLAHAVYHPGWRLRRSSSYYFAGEDHPRLRDAVAALVRGIHYSGQISFDWILGEDGRYRVLECNPRATSGLHLFTPDEDLPAALRGEGPLREPAPGSARMIAALMRTAGWWTAVRQGRLETWRRDWHRARDVIALPGDRLPAIGSIGDLGSYARLALGQRCNLREAATRDIEWDGEPLERGER